MEYQKIAQKNESLWLSRNWAIDKIRTAMNSKNAVGCLEGSWVPAQEQLSMGQT